MKNILPAFMYKNHIDYVIVERAELCCSTREMYYTCLTLSNPITVTSMHDKTISCVSNEIYVQDDILKKLLRHPKNKSIKEVGIIVLYIGESKLDVSKERRDYDGTLKKPACIWIANEYFHIMRKTEMEKLNSRKLEVVRDMLKSRGIK